MNGRQRILLVTLAALVVVVVAPAVLSQVPAEDTASFPAVHNGPASQDQKPAECTPEPPPERYHVADVTIMLERTPCFGFCPDYTVEIHGDGRVVYEGRNFVNVVGRQEAKIEREAFVTLLDDFYDLRFFDLRPEYIEERGIEVEDDGTVREYQVQVTDLPTQIVTLKIGEWEMRVVDYWDAPDDLRDLEQRIDDAAGTERWVGTP